MQMYAMILFSTIEGPLLQWWYTLPPAPPIWLLAKNAPGFWNTQQHIEHIERIERTVGGEPPPRAEAAYAYVRQYTSGSTNGLQSFGTLKPYPTSTPWKDMDCGA